ncbi:MAG: DNA alkylation repair protein [Lentisphaerae bacterium]|nr:DNA alkylation repair protein [Lentisphaerota bacterium]
MAALKRFGNARDAAVAASFFKTGPGEYGEGDVFVGVRVPQIRQLVRLCDALPEVDVVSLLQHRVHEARLLALLIMVRRFQRGDDLRRARLYDLYWRHREWINNWDLVDVSAEHILGGHLWSRSRVPLDRLAGSRRLWDRRLAVLATFHFIRRGEFGPTLRLALRLLRDEQDLMHKAVGWMLREVGNRDRAVEEAFLLKHYRRMPRTMLRYAIEKFPEARRQQYLKGVA